MFNQDKSINKMDIRRFKRSLQYLMATVLTALMSVGCSQSENGDDPDDPGFEEGIPTEVRITLSARSGNGTRANDANAIPKDPTSSVELIHDWWIAFIDKNGKVTVITRDQAEDKTHSLASSVSDPKGGFEAETFKMILPSGNYRIYAFANIPSKTAADFTALLDETELKLKNKYISDFVSTSFINENMQWPSNENIPMSAVKERTIRNTVEEAFNIEVIRAVAKVEFAFSKPATDNITLTKLEFSPISNENNISIAPNYDAVGKAPNDKLNGDKNVNKAGTMVFDYPTLTPTANYNMGVFDFYCQESLPAPGGGPFIIKLYVTKGTENKEYEYKTRDITYINRNDWILFPINFNNWVIKWALHTYPPIGGYPPVFNQSGSGETLEATMTTGGEFELYPVAITQNGENYTVNWDNDVTITVIEDNNHMLVNSPELKVNTNSAVSPVNSNKVIVGELDPKKEGTAKIRINFYLKDKNDNALDEVYTCLFTIHRQNSAPTQSTQ